MILRLNNIDVECVIGERTDERERLQELRVDVELTIPDTAAETDDLRDTVDYAALTERIRAALVAAKCKMIERAAKVVAEALPPLPARVTVTKSGAVPHLESSSVTYDATRASRHKTRSQPSGKGKMMKHLATAAIAALATASLFAEMEPATPESQGVDSQGILDFVDAAERAFDGSPEGPNLGHFHGFVIVRHGKVIAQGSWKPFDTLHETHMLYSHSKSFTSSAIGFLSDEGKLDLDERVVDIFTNDLPATVSENLAQLRVRDLLTMNVGKRDHLLRDGGDWAKAFLSKDFTRKPGTGFRYDSDATYMLAVIVEKKSGVRMMDYLKAKMFDRIGIKTAWTTFSPQGIPCGGWGMNMTTPELARFGQLYLQKGTWEGQQLLSPDWVSLATTRQTWCNGITIQSETIGSGSDWKQGYGFQFWRCRHGAFRADGAAGQYTVVLPEQDMVVSIHAGLGDMQKEINLIWDHLLPACRGEPFPENAALRAKLVDRLSKLEIAPLRSECSFPIEWKGSFKLAKNSRGFESVAFEPVDDRTVRCRLVTRAGEQSFLAGDGRWEKGDRIRIDTESYEGLGAYVGEHTVAASCGVFNGPVFRVRAYLTGDTGYLDFFLDSKGKLTGRFWAMNGCSL